MLVQRSKQTRHSTWQFSLPFLMRLKAESTRSYLMEARVFYYSINVGTALHWPQARAPHLQEEHGATIKCSRVEAARVPDGMIHVPGVDTKRLCHHSHRQCFAFSLQTLLHIREPSDKYGVAEVPFIKGDDEFKLKSVYPKLASSTLTSTGLRRATRSCRFNIIDKQRRALVNIAVPQL